MWIGDAARILGQRRQQKHDKRDAALLLQLLLEGRSRPEKIRDSDRRIMVAVGPYRWLVERFHRELIHRERSRASVLNLTGYEAVLEALMRRAAP